MLSADHEEGASSEKLPGKNILQRQTGMLSMLESQEYLSPLYRTFLQQQCPTSYNMFMLRCHAVEVIPAHFTSLNKNSTLYKRITGAKAAEFTPACSGLWSVTSG